MDDGVNDSPIKRIPIRDLKVEPEAESLLDSPAMQPYVNLAVAIMSGQDVSAATAEIAALPLEERYVWRVASALKWAFADLESVSVEADRQTLSPADQKRLLELLKHRPLQFCLFLGALLGQQQMEALMVSAVKQARMIAAHSE
jgi:hypothetical protein